MTGVGNGAVNENGPVNGRGAGAGGGSRRAAFWSALAAAVLGLACTVALVALLVWPGLSSARAIEIADGARVFAVPEAGVSVTPREGWAVRPTADGLLLHSPDRVLAVELTTAPEADVEAFFEQGAGDSAAVPVMSETLSSGLELRHVATGNGLTGVLDAPEGPLYIDAEVDASGWFEDYRPALSELVESIGADE